MRAKRVGKTRFNLSKKVLLLKIKAVGKGNFLCQVGGNLILISCGGSLGA